MKLYEINNAILDVIEKGFVVNEETGEVKFTADDLENLEIARDDKIENLCLYVKDLKSFAEEVKKEEVALKEKREKILRKAENITNYVDFVLGGKKFETAKCSVTYRKSAKVVISDCVELPEEYTKVKVEPDKTAIKNAIKSGVQIDGCAIEETNNIQIK